MHARVVTFMVHPNKIETLTSIHRDDVLPALQGQKGFSGSRLLVDPSSGKSMIVTLWEGEADMKANEGTGWFREQLAKFNAVFASPPTRETYEVKVMV
jgi:heme-degrading monooxygenase HmoA